jgi:hypothetical protein
MHAAQKIQASEIRKTRRAARKQPAPAQTQIDTPPTIIVPVQPIGDEGVGRGAAAWPPNTWWP